MPLRMADLFCGAGGLSLGFRQAGFEPVFAADWDQHACQTYRTNLGAHVHQLDLGEIPAERLASIVDTECGKIDVVAGGPPCQGFSVQRRGKSDDPRNQLLLQFGRMAARIRPKAIVMENVPTILGPRGRAYLTEIERMWVASGYDIGRTILEAAAFGVPQFRRRAFVVAVQREYCTSFTFPEPQLTPEQYVTVRQSIGELPPPPEDLSEHPSFANHRRVAISSINLERLSHVPEGGGRLDVPISFQLPCHRNSNGHRHLDVYGRLWWDRPSSTITAMFDNFTRGRFAHPEQTRNITAREGARLQSFPDDYVFSGPKKDVARQIGNAVCPLLARAVAEAVLDALLERPVSTNKPRQRAFAF